MYSASGLNVEDIYNETELTITRLNFLVGVV